MVSIFLFATSHLYNIMSGFSVSSFIFCTMCCFSKKEQPPPQTGMPPSVCRVWTEFLSDSETWIEFRRNYSLRLKPELPPSMCSNRFKYGNYLGDIDNSGYCKYLPRLIRILAAGWLAPNLNITEQQPSQSLIKNCHRNVLLI